MKKENLSWEFVQAWRKWKIRRVSQGKSPHPGKSPAYDIENLELKNWTNKYWYLKKLKYSCVTAETNKAEKQPRPPEKAKLSTVYATIIFEGWRYFNVSEKVNYTKKVNLQRNFFLNPEWSLYQMHIMVFACWNL